MNGQELDLTHLSINDIFHENSGVLSYKSLYEALS